MTDEQKQLVEQNHNLIYFYLHRHNLSIEDYYDVAAIGLCKAAITFKKDKSEFSTYALTCIKNEVNMIFRKFFNQRTIPESSVVSIQQKILGGDDNLDLESCISSVVDVEDEAIANASIKKFIAGISDREKMILQLYNAGYGQVEISERVGISQGQVSRDINNLLKRFKKGVK